MPADNTRKLETAKKKALFLKAVVENGGNISAACKKARIERSYLYKLEVKDPEFAEAFREAQAQGLKALEDEARRRAYSGVKKDIYYRGQKCGEEINYSDTLTIFLLKGGMPEKYGDKVKMAGHDGGELKAPVTLPAELAEMMSKLTEAIKAER